jgi:hypothetical protein
LVLQSQYTAFEKNAQNWLERHHVAGGGAAESYGKGRKIYFSGFEFYVNVSRATHTTIKYPCGVLDAVVRKAHRRTTKSCG